MDGTTGVTQCHIQPGATAVYHFAPDKPGTFWWHSHDVSQYAFELRGPIIIHPALSRSRQQQQEQQYHLGARDGVAAEYTLQLADWYHAKPVGPPLWDTVLINSRSRYNCSVAKANNLTCSTDQPLTRIQFKSGKTYLLRLINEGALAPILFSIDGHEFAVIAADAEPVVQSKPINALLMNVGQRYDIIVRAKSAVETSSSSSFWIRATS